MKLLLPFFLAAASALFLLCHPPQADAAASKQTKARLHVLTLECVLESINNGITDIQFLQPSDCEKEVVPASPVPTETPSRGISLEPAEGNGSTVTAFYNPAVPSQQISDLQAETSPLVSLPEANLLVKSIVALFYFQLIAVLFSPLLLLSIRGGFISLIRNYFL